METIRLRNVSVQEYTKRMSSPFATPLAQFADRPPEGIAVVPLRFLFNSTAGTVQTKPSDYALGQAQGQLTQCRSVFVDNSANIFALTIAFRGGGQTLVIPGGTQGFYSVLVPTTIEFDISTIGVGSNVLVTMFLINVLIPSAEWTPASGIPATGSGGAIMPYLIGNQRVIGSFSAAAGTVLLPADASWAYYITGVTVSVGLDASVAAAGSGWIDIEDSDGAIWQTAISLPAIAGGITQPGAFVAQTPPGFFYNSKSLGQPISAKVVGLGDLSTGTIQVVLSYGKTKFVG